MVKPLNSATDVQIHLCQNMHLQVQAVDGMFGINDHYCRKQSHFTIASPCISCIDKDRIILRSWTMLPAVLMS